MSSVSAKMKPARAPEDSGGGDEANFMSRSLLRHQPMMRLSEDSAARPPTKMPGAVQSSSASAGVLPWMSTDRGDESVASAAASAKGRTRRPEQPG